MKRLLFSAAIALGTLCVQSQELPTIVPPSPEASALAKFTEVPVSHYTGLPNISVPIYTIQEGGVSVPISLSYHARGVQVSSVASRTGTGWSLSYGGSISRQMRGKSDEHIHGYLNLSNYFTNYPTDSIVRANVMTYESLNGFDFYPDQFTFNAGGVSGKFVLNHQDGQPLIQSFGDVSISYTQDSGVNGTKINAFVITDAGGNKYYFGISKDGLRTAQDYQDSTGYTVDLQNQPVLDPSPTDDDDFYSAWKLLDIETVTGDLISFYYNSHTAPYWRKSSDLHINPSPGGTTTGVNGMSDIGQIRSKISRIQNYEHQLDSIKFNDGRDKIVFIPETTAREDFVGYALDKVAIYHDNTLIKGFDLNYEYTTSTDTSNMLASLSIDPELAMYFKRLFLKEVAEYGNDNSTLPPYEFIYDSQILPAMMSSKQDYWGYYNGAENNGPFTRVFPYGFYVPDRRVDTLKSEAGILKEIKYPTGGKARFTYEHNKGTNVPWSARVKLPAINPSTGTNYQSLNFLDTLAYNGDKYIGNTFTINSDPNGVSASISVNLLPTNYNSADQNVACDNPLQPECGFNIKLEGLNGAPTYTLFAGDTDFSSIQPGDYRFVFDPINDNNWSNSPGTWNYNAGGVFTPFPYTFNMQISWQQQSVSELLYGPGKRIQKIEHIDAGGVVSVKEFEYRYAVNTELGVTIQPSGSIKGLPAFLNKPITGYDGNFFGYTGQHYTSYYDSGSAYSSFQSNFIGYSGVIEYHGTKDDNIGKVEYTFTNFNDSGGDFFEFPYHPPTDNEWLRGKPIKVSYYKNDGVTNGNIDYALAKEVKNTYRYGDSLYAIDFVIPFGGVEGLQFTQNTPHFIFIPPGEEFDWGTNSNYNYSKTRTNFRLPLFMVKRFAQGGGVNNPSYYNAYRMYDLTGGTLNMQSVTEKIFHATDTLETITTYNYNYPYHYQQKGSTMTDSRGDVVETTTHFPAEVKYTYDLGYDDLSTAELDAIKHMKAPTTNHPTRTHQLATPIQVETKRNTILQSVVRTNFKIESSGLVLPKSVATLKGSYNAISNPLEERVVYHSYYDNGNVKEVSKTDGTHIVYIWGYDQTVPIAKIENATFSDIPTAVYNAILNASNADNDRTEGSLGNEGTLRTELNKLRDPGLSPDLVGAQVTSFTYDPLIGVTSITDPRGRTAYYRYDSFNRLQFVKDHDGNILSENQYNYKN